MDVSELRKRILRSLDEARRDAAARRQIVDNATRAYEQFLSEIAVPLMRQATIVLNGAGQLFAVHTPASTVRLAAEKDAHTFLELALDVTPAEPQVIGRVSVTRGRQGLILEERPVAKDKGVAELTEDDVSAFLVTEIPKLVMRT